MCSCWSARVSGRNWDERASVIGRGGAKAFETAGKAFDIPKDLVVKAWQRVRSNNGAPGVDGAAIENFERDLQANLYKIWNRMSLGCRAGRSGSRLLRGKQLPEGGGRALQVGVEEGLNALVGGTGAVSQPTGELALASQNRGHETVCLTLLDRCRNGESQQLQTQGDGGSGGRVCSCHGTSLDGPNDTLLLRSAQKERFSSVFDVTPADHLSDWAVGSACGSGGYYSGYSRILSDAVAEPCCRLGANSHSGPRCVVYGPQSA